VLNFDDLLFEKRNKDYGAYQLRRKYNSVLTVCVIFVTVIVSSALVLPFVISPGSKKVLRGGSGYVQYEMEVFEPPVDIVVPPPPPPPQSAKIPEIVKYVPPVVVDTVLPMEHEQVTTDELLAQNPNDQLEMDGVGTGSSDDSMSGIDGLGNDEPFFIVEVMPAFKGGDINKFREWVQRRTNYPQEAIEKKIQGKVFLTFIVEPDGVVTNVTVVKGVDPLIDNEAITAIQSSPKWTPGFQRGQPVRVRYSMWLSFVF